MSYSDLETLDQRIANTNSIRGALFVLKNDIGIFGNCHIAYEYFVQKSAYIRGDLVNMTTLPDSTNRLYVPSGGTNSDPIIENISELEGPMFVDLEKMCFTGNLRYYKNPFFMALMDMGCLFLASYPILFGNRAGYGAITVFETSEQHHRGIEDSKFLEIGLSFHNAIKSHGQLAKFFKLSEKERLVLEQMATGKSANDIAHNLQLTPRTVEQRLQNARKKLRARTTTEAVYKAAVYAIIAA